MEQIYLDHNATSPVDPRVLDEMDAFHRTFLGNPSSIHSFGREAKKILEDARETVAAFLGASPPEIIFTSGGTEADNLAILGALAAAPEGRDQIIISSVEHAAVRHLCERLQHEGLRATWLPVDPNGVVDPASLRRSITPRTTLISVMHSNNETGTLQPVEHLSQIAAENSVPFHTDAVQSFGRISLNVRDLGVDMLSFSAHKCGGPRGIGGLYVKKGARIKSIMSGGHQEFDLRPGTENLQGIVGLAAKCKIAAEEMPPNSDRIRRLRDLLESQLTSHLDNIAVNSQTVPRLPNTSSVAFLGLEAEMLLLSLDVRGVAASAGSACSSGSSEPSHVLAAMGLPDEVVRGTLRFSLGRTTTEDEVRRAASVIEEVVRRLSR